jgi:hypothetical protein
MAFDGAGRGMVAGDGQHVGPLLQQDRQRGVEILDRLFLRLEIAVLAVHVGVFEMDEEVIEVVVLGQVARNCSAMVCGPSIFFMPTNCARPLYMG